MPGALTYLQVTIAATESLSTEADLTGWRLAAIQMPTGWDAAALTFQARPGKRSVNEALQNVYDDGGTELSVTTAASRYVTLTGAKLDALLGAGKLKVRSGTVGLPVVQSVARVLVLVVVPLT